MIVQKWSAVCFSARFRQRVYPYLYVCVCVCVLVRYSQLESRLVRRLWNVIVMNINIQGEPLISKEAAKGAYKTEMLNAFSIGGILLRIMDRWK